MAAIQRELGLRAVIWKQPVAGLLTMTGQFFTVGINGMADLGGVLQGGRAFQIEVKTGGATLEAHQRAWRERMETLGVLYVIARAPHESDQEAAAREVCRVLRAGCTGPG